MIFKNEKWKMIFKNEKWKMIFKNEKWKMTFKNEKWKMIFKNEKWKIRNDFWKLESIFKISWRHSSDRTGPPNQSNIP